MRSGISVVVVSAAVICVVRSVLTHIPAGHRLCTCCNPTHTARAEKERKRDRQRERDQSYQYKASEI